VQPYAEDSIHNSSIFTPLWVINQRHPIISCNCQLSVQIRGKFVWISRAMYLCPIPLQMQKPCDRRAVSRVISQTADHQRTPESFSVLLQAIHHCQCSPLHQNLRWNPHLLNGITIQLLHLCTVQNTPHIPPLSFVTPEKSCRRHSPEAIRQLSLIYSLCPCDLSCTCSGYK